MSILNTITINGIEYPLATNLRVAYKLQGCNDHKPYSQIFSEMAEMPVEKQLEMLYVSLCVGTPMFESQMKFMEFCNYCYDNMNVNELMIGMKKIMAGIMGKEYVEVEEENKNKENKSSDDTQVAIDAKN